MTLTAGARFGPYEVLSTLGVGGMGEVYRARDTRLDRDVAIKVLPETFTSDQDRLARFQREAKVLASLNHPNIAAIYGIEDSNASYALVMELVEGPTLADRIAQGPVAVAEALSIARQIAEALASAHDCGIIHRDLKPANIKLRPDGTVKLLDFGIAKAIEPSNPLSPEVSESPTVTAAALTEAGVILGTAPYMSPEQARGQRVNAQTDIWAFGCVLYEMLSGRAAFRRATLTDTMAAVIESEPDWSALPRATPDSVVRLLRRALEKNSSRRLHAIADARLDLDEARDAMAAPPPVASSTRARRSLTLAAAAAAVIILLLGAALWRTRNGESASTLTPTRLSIAAPGQVTPQLSVAVSPDGRRLAYVATDAVGGSKIWVRDLNALAPHALAGTEDAAHPFWAPDGSAIGFVAGGKLKRVDAGGGNVLALADVETRSGAAWSPTGVILFTPRQGEFATVPDTGGPVSTVLTSGNWPCFLPDGRHFLFHAIAREGVEAGVYVGSFGSQTTKLVLPGDFQAVFAPPDYLLTARDEGLVFAQHFDLTQLEVTGEPIPVAEGVWSARLGSRLSVSATSGVLAYINASLENTEPAWFDRSGRPIGTLGAPGPYQAQSPRIAPDGASVVMAHVRASPGIWVTRIADGTTRQLTLETGATRPIWSSDASRILFQWARGANDVAVSIQDARGIGSAQFAGAIGGYVLDWSPDGQRLVFGRGRPSDLWILPVGASGDPVLFARSAFNKTQAQVSPNGRWITYTSLDTGRDEVYVDSFPVAGNRRQVSVGGGMQPRWRRDGSELFYLAPDQMLMAVPVNSKSEYFDAGRAAPLFRTRLLPEGSQIPGWPAMYDVTPDGQRFLINGPLADPGPPITVVLNWTAGLNGRR
jgi:Tol biopolymer transport system component